MALTFELESVQGWSEGKHRIWRLQAHGTGVECGSGADRQGEMMCRWEDGGKCPRPSDGIGVTGLTEISEGLI